MSTSSRHDHHLGAVTEEQAEDSDESDSDTMSTTPRNKRDDLVNPYWIEDPDLGKGEVEYLSSSEIQFWKDLLAKYLYPIDENKEEKVRFDDKVSNYVCWPHFRFQLDPIQKSNRYVIGPHSRRFKGTERSVCICLLYDECPLRADRVLAYPEERLPPCKVALWRENEHNL